MREARNIKRQLRFYRRWVIEADRTTYAAMKTATSFVRELHDLSLAFQAAAPVAFEEFEKRKEDV